MDIRWLGHSCFEIKNSDGVTLLTDPYDPSTGRELKDLTPDIVTISHEHHDHNYLNAVKPGCKPEVIRGAGKYTVSGVCITGYNTYHDEKEGALRGGNVMFLYEIDGMRVLHCGDVGKVPDDAVIDQIGRVDVMLVPVGGVYTISGDGAREFANKLHPRVLIPMHYNNAGSGFTIALEGLDTFLSRAKNCRIHRLNQDRAQIMPDSLGSDRILVFRV